MWQWCGRGKRIFEFQQSWISVFRLYDSRTVWFFIGSSHGGGHNHVAVIMMLHRFATGMIQDHNNWRFGPKDGIGFWGGDHFHGILIDALGIRGVQMCADAEGAPHGDLCPAREVQSDHSAGNGGSLGGIVLVGAGRRHHGLCSNNNNQQARSCDSKSQIMSLIQTCKRSQTRLG